jgi:hypothetical protein
MGDVLSEIQTEYPFPPPPRIEDQNVTAALACSLKFVSSEWKGWSLGNINFSWIMKDCSLVRIFKVFEEPPVSILCPEDGSRMSYRNIGNCKPCQP